MNERLLAFSPGQRRTFEERVAPVDPSLWPPLDGFLAVLCASRSGSTALCRELERRYAFGRINESLRLARLARIADDQDLGSIEAAIAATILSEGEAGWFGFKASAEALLVGELSGLIPARLDRLRLILLLRRDLIAQAVSMTKAEQTGVWHSGGSRGAPIGEAAYDAVHIDRSVRRILTALEALRLYAGKAGVPTARLFYEDFAEGDFTCLEAVGDVLALPRRAIPSAPAWRAVRKIGDAVNLEWAERFAAEMDDEMRRRLARYQAFCSAEPCAWNESLAADAAGPA